MVVRAGRVYTVASVFLWEGETCLTLVEVPAETAAHFGYPACYFIRVTPEEPDTFDQETLELSNLSPVTVEG